MNHPNINKKMDDKVREVRNQLSSLEWIGLNDSHPTVPSSTSSSTPQQRRVSPTTTSMLALCSGSTINSGTLHQSSNSSSNNIGGTTPFNIPNNNSANNPTPQLVHQSSTTSIYRQNNVGYKVVLPRDIHKLQHEQDIYNYLPPSVHKRQVLDITSFHHYSNHPVLRFQWTSGVTLQEWLLNYHQHHSNPRIKLDNLKLCIKFAIAITKTLSSFHTAGVVMCTECYSSRLSTKDIVLSQEEKDGMYVATFVDLSHCTILENHGGGEAGNGGASMYVDQAMKQYDLKQLGLILNQLFQGIIEDGKFSEGSQRDGRYHNGSHPSLNTLHTEQQQDCVVQGGKRQSLEQGTVGLPFYLNSLTTALTIDSSYQNAQDVVHDLKILDSNTNAADIFLTTIDIDESTANSRIRLPQHVFHGRQVELSMLQHLIKSTVAEQNNNTVGGNRLPKLMGTISGYPGTGKSALARQLKKQVETEYNGNFIEGKFEKNTHPDTVLALALNDFFGNLLTSQELKNRGSSSSIDSATTMDTLHTSMKWRIQDSIGSGGSHCHSVFFDMIPNLQRWLFGDEKQENEIEATSGAAAAQQDGLESTTSTTSTTGTSSSGVKGVGPMIKFMFCKLIGAIACKAQPLVLFLDDLQWADEMTLDIVQMIVADADIHHMLFLGSYRNNEADESNLLIEKLSAIKAQGTSVIPIKVGPIERESVNTLVSEVLHLPPTLAKPLSAIVHSKTGGIILFVLRFLMSLSEDGELWFNKSSRRWMYDLNRIEVKEVHGDVVSLLTMQMKSLPKKMRFGLKVVSCLGANFNPRALELIKKNDEVEDSFFDDCVDLGFLRKINDLHYVWAHDLIQQGALDLIPVTKREAFHLLIGSRLFMNSNPPDMNSMIYYIVDNMNKGRNLIHESDQRYELAELNLQASQKAVAASAFQSAANFLLTGLGLLGTDCWGAQYYLTMRLYNAASEVLYITGDFERLKQLCQIPLDNARSFDDKLMIHNNLIRVLAASYNFGEGISTCISLLSQLGISLPTEPMTVLQKEISDIKTLLHGKSEQELISLPTMNEPRKLAAMQFLLHLQTMSFFAEPLMNPIVIIKMVKYTLEFGVSNIACFAFSSYGAVLVSEPCNDVEMGYMMGRIGLSLMKRLDAVEMKAKVHQMVYGTINLWKEPWQATLDMHLEAYESGSMTGDTEYAFTNLAVYANKATFGCGVKLDSLSLTIQSFAKRAFQYNQQGFWVSLVIFHQLTLDLRGIEANAFSPYSSDMTEDVCFANSCSRNAHLICRLICNKKKFVAFYLGDMDLCAEMYDQGEQFHTGPTGRLVSAIVSTFINGLLGFYFARKYRGQEASEAKWLTIALDSLNNFQKWVKHSDWNFSNKLWLLEAEKAFYEGKTDVALTFYQTSIRDAKAHKFIHEEGLAEEKLATYLLRMGNPDNAVEHFRNAKKCYQEWKAEALVTRVEKAIEMLLPMCTTIQQHDS